MQTECKLPEEVDKGPQIKNQARPDPHRSCRAQEITDSSKYPTACLACGLWLILKKWTQDETDHQLRGLI